MNERRNDALLAAIMDVVAGLDLHTTLLRIVESARMLSHAKYGALGILGEDGKIAEFVHVGMEPELVAKMPHPPTGKGVLGLLISEPKAIRMDDLRLHPSSTDFPEGHPPMHSFLGVPVRVRGQVFGNLYLTEKQDTGHFTEEDEDVMKSLAAIAGLAIENARLYEQAQQLAIYQDRDRIARDLHDLVIQRLFATGMSLQSVARQPTLPTAAADKVRDAIDDMDETIKQLRQTIYALTVTDTERVTLRRRIMHEVETYANLLRTAPALTFDGAVDTLTEERVADQVLAALRELLSNAVRHAKAHQLSVSVQILDSNLVLSVADDGVGIPEDAKRSGLENLRARAEALGGSFEIRRRSPSGTRARWSVPVR